ncbi:MAG: hypothetical protein ACI4MS_01215 [Candidatus Coproplasma sp.]
MKLFKKIVTVFTAMVCVLGVCALSACNLDKNEEANNIDVSGYIYIDGQQPLFIEGQPSLNGDEAARFKDTIAASDIVLGGELAGKTVASVEYKDESSLVVYFDGRARDFEGDSVYCKLTVKGSATKDGKNSYGYVILRKPKLTCTGGMYFNQTLKSRLSLPYGEFIEDNVTTENITAVEPAGAKVEEVYLSDGNLYVTVSGLADRYDYPTISISASVTSFNKQITITLSAYSTAELY